MIRAVFHLCGLAVVVESPEESHIHGIEQLWRRVFVLDPLTSPTEASSICLQFNGENNPPTPLSPQDVVYESRHVTILKTDSGFAVTCQNSVLNLHIQERVGTGKLGRRFWSQPIDTQRTFFLIALMALFTGCGLYGLHSNALVREGAGVLIAGSPNSGKTTLTLSMVLQGWNYLSDDALVLLDKGTGIQALAVRRGFSCTRETMDLLGYPGDLSYDVTSLKSEKVLIDVEEHHAGACVSECYPRIVVFPQIVRESCSRLVPVSSHEALLELVRQCPGIMTLGISEQEHFQVIGHLTEQVTSYRLFVGQDTYRRPAILSELLSRTLEGPFGDAVLA